MAKVVLKPGETLEQGLKRFKRITVEIAQEAKKRAFYLRPGLKKREKAKKALEKLRKRKARRY